MSLLDRVRGLMGKSGGTAAAGPSHECTHASLTPHWDDSADMGDETKASAFICNSCQERLTPAEAGWARKRAVEQLRR
ncbi:MAG: hypothetical protein O3A10_00020 [Chloroflexi bacterium]|nr:hypothetical protein [Chloroflexota bacterium]MDA1145345.1 hypothetical protein [Chloroflexota bacterium]